MVRQFAGPMVAEVAHELALLAVDLETNKSWDSMRDRLHLRTDCSLADVRDAILMRHGNSEPDSRVKDTVTATVLQYFEALCRYNDDVLYGPGKPTTFDALDSKIVKGWLDVFLRLHYENVLLREEPKLPDTKLRRSIEEVAATLGGNLSRKLSGRYSPSGKARGTYLRHAGSDPEETTWLLKAVRG